MTDHNEDEIASDEEIAKRTGTETGPVTGPDAAPSGEEAPVLPPDEIRAVLEALIFAAQETKADMIVTFLALLELIRLKRVKVYQRGIFGPIRVFRPVGPKIPLW